MTSRFDQSIEVVKCGAAARRGPICRSNAWDGGRGWMRRTMRWSKCAGPCAGPCADQNAPEKCAPEKCAPEKRVRQTSRSKFSVQIDAPHLAPLKQDPGVPRSFLPGVALSLPLDLFHFSFLFCLLVFMEWGRLGQTGLARHKSKLIARKNMSTDTISLSLSLSLSPLSLYLSISLSLYLSINQSINQSIN